ncbi:hypothetical protein F4782DRAFT_97190 [Xylaria castorea]|nr:hypothetical protein F4782DRAFT_97190 [Xylaria castorea]
MPYDSEGGPSILLSPWHQSVESNQGSTGINTFTCQVCHQSFIIEWQLNQHSKAEFHATWDCAHSGCCGRFSNISDRNYHQSTPHLPGHREVWDDSAIACAECNETFHFKSEVVNHARNKKHSPYACCCGVKFARRDVLIRHLEGFTKESAKHQCPFCKRHRGKHAFRRRDHLVQHLRGYHKMEPEEINKVSRPTCRVQSRQILICPHTGCEAYRDDAFKALPWIDQHEDKPFQKQSDYNKHMRDVHEESAFSCPVAACDRVGVKGYMREKDLMKHLADKHPEAPSYSHVPPGPLEYRCEMCGKGYSTGYTLNDHRRYTCIMVIRNGLNTPTTTDSV